MKRYTPRIIIKYLLKEFSLSLLIFFSIFFSLITLSTYLEEIIFFREKALSGNFFIQTFMLSLNKLPSILINMSPFIFLFSGIFFFAKLIKNKEIAPLSISGFSNNYITFVPAVFSFFIGCFIILIVTPFSSQLLKQYEIKKQKFSSNENLIIFNNTGLWMKEKKENFKYIIKSDNIIDQNFNELKNIIIYKFDENNNFIERIDSKKAFIKNNYWDIKKAFVTNNKLEKKNKSYKFYTNISLKKLKQFFINSSTFSIWNINTELKNIRERGYYGQELVITLNKYLSLPFMLFSMIVISTFFTLRLGYNFNNLVYAFFGVLIGILIYFLSDLSIAIGKSGTVPLILSIWIPVIFIVMLSMFILLEEKDE